MTAIIVELHRQEAIPQRGQNRSEREHAEWDFAPYIFGFVVLVEVSS